MEIVLYHILFAQHSSRYFSSSVNVQIHPPALISIILFRKGGELVKSSFPFLRASLANLIYGFLTIASLRANSVTLLHLYVYTGNDAAEPDAR